MKGLTPIAGGFSILVSAGSKETKRIQFRLRILTGTDKALARTRLAAILGMRDALVQAKRGPDAKYLMTQAGAAAGDDELFAVAIGTAALACEIGPVRHGGFDSWGEMADAWASGEARRLYPDVRIKFKKSAERDAQRIEWLKTFIGDVPLATFGKLEYRHAMSNLPARCKTDGTRRAYGQIILKVMRIAHAAGLIETNRVADLQAPKVEPGDKPFFTCPFPDELYRLLACARVKFKWRALWGFMCVESPRIGYLPEVRWHHVEREGTGALSMESKSGEMLYWALAPGTLALLEEIERRMPGLSGPFAWLTTSAVEKAAATFRRHLMWADNTRKSLHENDGRRRRVRAHDTRAFFIVNAKRAGRNEEWIKQRTGHTTSIMIETYNRLLPIAEAKNWTPFGRLDEALGLVPAAAEVAAAEVAATVVETVAEPVAEAAAVAVAAGAEPVAGTRPVVSRDSSRDSDESLARPAARGDRESSMIYAVAPTGVEPVSPFGRGILSATSDDRSAQNTGVSAPCDAPEVTGPNGPSRVPVTVDPVLESLRASAHACVEAGDDDGVAELMRMIAKRRPGATAAPVAAPVVAPVVAPVASLDAARRRRRDEGSGK